MPVTRPTLGFALVMPSKRRQEKPKRFVIGSSVPCFPSVPSRQATRPVEADGLNFAGATSVGGASRQRVRRPRPSRRRDPKVRAIVAAIIVLAHALDLNVVAEGVELASQRQVLIDLGCDQAQGFFYAASGTPEQIDDLVLPGSSLQ